MKAIEQYKKGIITESELASRVLQLEHEEIKKVLNDLPPNVFEHLKNLIQRFVRFDDNVDIKVYCWGGQETIIKHETIIFVKDLLGIEK